MQDFLPRAPRGPVSIALAALGLAACAGTGPAELEPLEIRTAWPTTEYQAVLAAPEPAAAAVVPLEAAGFHRALFGGAEPVAPEGGATATPTQMGETTVTVETQMVCLDLDMAEAFLGWTGDSPWAFLVDRRELERRLAPEVLARYGSLSSSPTLTLWDGGQGDLSLVNEQAYLREFRFAQTGSNLLADPEIGIVRNGYSLHVRAKRTGPEDEGRVELELSLALAELERPIREERVRLPLGGVSVTLQRPLLLAQRQSVQVTLGPADALVLVALGQANSGELLFTFLTAHP